MACKYRDLNINLQAEFLLRPGCHIRKEIIGNKFEGRKKITKEDRS